MPRLISNQVQPSKVVVKNLLFKQPYTYVPIITLNGDNPMYIEQNNDYDEPNATSGTLSVNIDNSLVDTTKLGQYIVTYSATHPISGLTGSKSRTVIVQDTTAPVITLLGDNPMYVTQNTTYVDPGATTTDDSVSIVVRYDYTVTGVVNVSVLVGSLPLGGSFPLPTLSSAPSGVINIKYFATDSSNNIGRALRTVYITESDIDTDVNTFSPGSDLPTSLDAWKELQITIDVATLGQDALDAYNRIFGINGYIVQEFQDSADTTLFNSIKSYSEAALSALNANTATAQVGEILNSNVDTASDVVTLAANNAQTVISTAQTAQETAVARAAESAAAAADAAAAAADAIEAQRAAAAEQAAAIAAANLATILAQLDAMRQMMADFNF